LHYVSKHSLLRPDSWADHMASLFLFLGACNCEKWCYM
jgi:hypothetical protein